MTRLSLTRVARSIGQAAVVAVMVWGRPSAADEVQPGAVSCAPGDASFDRGFRAALQLSQLATVDTARKHGVIPNAFCLACDRPNVLPLRVRVRVRCDAG